MKPETDPAATPLDKDVIVPDHFESRLFSSEAELTEKFLPVTDKSISSEEVLILAGSTVTPESEAAYETIINTALCVYGLRLREDNSLIGIGMLIGDAEHAEINHCFMHPDYQESGLPELLFQGLENYAKDHGIHEVGIATDSD